MRRLHAGIAVPLAAAVALASVLEAWPVAAQADRALLVVLDASASMNEPVEGGVKSDLARRGLIRAMGALEPKTRVGLRALGEGPVVRGCTRTRTVIPIGPFDRAVWNTEFDGILWRGATPLSLAMREGFADLRRVDASRREMLVIADGSDSCGEDPVTVARAEANGIRVHTISLGAQISPSMAGIALVTGGTYSRAFSDETFNDATGSALPPEPESPAPGDGNSGAANRLEIILDMSNSMWGQVDGRPKIELARDALTTALADWPPSLPIGLRVYGHRVPSANKADGCLDTERVLDSAPGTAAAIVATARRLSPRGHTPIARSLEEAASDLRTSEGSSVILLLTDGVESCGGDPKAVIERLRASGLPVVLHTVGLGVGAGEAQSLAALAEAGGGSYFNAPTAADLMQGVAAAVRTGSGFRVQADPLVAFPRDVARVRGGDNASGAETLEPGSYSLTEHLFQTRRYFAVRGTPGEVLSLRGLVCALALRPLNPERVAYRNLPSSMMIEAVTPNGTAVRGSNVEVRGDMGTWSAMKITVGPDGLARFRVGWPAGSVHRDMIFQVVR